MPQRSPLPPFTRSCRKSALRAQSSTASDNLRTMRDRPFLSPHPPPLLVSCEVMPPVAAIPTLPQRMTSLPPSLPSSAASSAVRRHSTSPTIASLPLSANRRHVHDARMRGTGSKGRRRQQCRHCSRLSPLWGHILVNFVSALQHPFWNQARGILPASLNRIESRSTTSTFIYVLI